MHKEKKAQHEKEVEQGRQLQEMCDTDGWKKILVPMMLTVRNQQLARVIGLDLGPALARAQEVVKVIDTILKFAQGAIEIGRAAEQLLQTEPKGETGNKK